VEDHVSEGKTGTGKAVLAILLAGAWVNSCEFVRNQLLLAAQWKSHFAGMGLDFPAQPLNAAVWVVWAFGFTALVFAVSRRFGLLATAVIGWVAGFVMMWFVIGNLRVLPLGILPVAVPFSMVEAFGAAFICRKLARRSRA
jgi:hypothetical protein